MFEYCEIASAEERGKNEVLRKLSREIWSKMVDALVDAPADGSETDIHQVIRHSQFAAYKDIKDLVDSMVTDKEDYVSCKSYAIESGLIRDKKED